MIFWLFEYGSGIYPWRRYNSQRRRVGLSRNMTELLQLPQSFFQILLLHSQNLLQSQSTRRDSFAINN